MNTPLTTLAALSAALALTSCATVKPDPATIGSIEGYHTICIGEVWYPSTNAMTVSQKTITQRAYDSLKNVTGVQMPPRDEYPEVVGFDCMYKEQLIHAPRIRLGTTKETWERLIEANGGAGVFNYPLVAARLATIKYDPVSGTVRFEPPVGSGDLIIFLCRDDDTNCRKQYKMGLYDSRTGVAANYRDSADYADAANGSRIDLTTFKPVQPGEVASQDKPDYVPVPGVLPPWEEAAFKANSRKQVLSAK